MDLEGVKTSCVQWKDEREGSVALENKGQKKKVLTAYSSSLPQD